MRVRHERGKFVLRAKELVHRVIVMLIFFAFDLAVDVPIEDLRRQALGWILPVERVGTEIGQVLFRPVEVALLMRGRWVAEFGVMTSDAKLLDQSQRGKQLRLFEQHLDEDLFVKEIQAPGAEPDEVDGGNGRHQEQDGQNAESPLQGASDHPRLFRSRRSSVNLKFTPWAAASRLFLQPHRNFLRFAGFPLPQGGSVKRRLTKQRKGKQ